MPGANRRARGAQTGKFMRHVKAMPAKLPDRESVKMLIQAAYADIKLKLAAEVDVRR